MTGELLVDRVRWTIMRTGILALMLISVLTAAGCSSDDETTTTLQQDTTTPSTSVAGDDATGTTVTTSPSGSTTTTEVLAALPAYDIAHRSPGDNGDTLVVVLQDSGAPVTDHDLEQVILDVVDSYGPVAEAHLIDDPSVLELVLADPADLTDEQKALLADHYLLRLTDGTSVSFEGPFEDVPGYEIGS